MKKRLIPLTDAGRECMENILATVINSKSVNYPLIYCTTWSFDFKKENSRGQTTLGDRLIADWGKMEDNAKAFLGIQIQFRKIPDPADAYARIVQEISRGEVAAFTLDIQYCVWHAWHQIQNTREHTLISYRTTKQGDLICVDCQPPREEIVLTKQIFMNAYRSLVVLFENVAYRIPDSCDFCLKQTLERLNHSLCYKNAFEAMRAFARELEQVDFSNEFLSSNEQDIWNSKLFHTMYCLEIGRIQYAKYLVCLQQMTNNDRLEEIEKLIVLAGHKWALLRTMALKFQLGDVSRNGRRRLYNLVCSCADIEENAYGLLKKVVE